MSITETAKAFFVACETGKGWDGCKEFCQDGASFSCQADALAEISNLEGYVEWMKGLMSLMPDGNYDLKSFSTDTEKSTVCAFAVFHGTHTEEGGPVPPTGKKAAADYVYAMEFDGDKISHMTKIWNDGYTLKQLGWA